MGLLAQGTPLGWPDTKKLADYVRKHGILQFIHHYKKLCDRQGDCLKWGDEIEYMVVKFDHDNKRVQLSLRGGEILQTLMSTEDTVDLTNNEFLWRPEYAAYMLEGTPGNPYGGLLACFNVVEDNMKRRREAVNKLLNKGEVLMSIPCFPRIGCRDFVTPSAHPNPRNPNSVAKSLFFPDDAIFGVHPRFKTLTRNIRERKGSKVVINVPVFKDEKTQTPFVEDFTELGDDGEAAAAAKPDHVYLDAMGFGMGCCCLQVTFQAVNVDEARWLYDQLTPITPIMLALSAATPITRGYLLDVDSRWDIISASVDDRTPEEMGKQPLKDAQFRINTSRYDVTESYLYRCSAVYNDIPLVLDRELYNQLKEAKIDELLARHVAHLFIRDPVMLYQERVDLDDHKSTEHFENIQSSNWMNMRFKPPPADGPPIGWRVEFRPTEIQLTDFENAAYVVFVVLLTRVLVSFRLSMLIPISKVNENMKRAQKRDAVLNEKFWFRKGVATCNTPPVAQLIASPDENPSADPLEKPEETVAEYCEMSIDEIVNGSKEPDGFRGLIPLMFQYLDSADVDVDTRCTIQQYLKFIGQRAAGTVDTLAHWTRNFVRGHREYKQDSVVSERIQYDLLSCMHSIAQERCHCFNLLGEFRSKTTNGIPKAVLMAESMYSAYKANNNKAGQ